MFRRAPGDGNTDGVCQCKFDGGKNVPAAGAVCEFWASSLDFELRVWVLDADYRRRAKSELHQEIEQRFREANIEIAFPQMDLHLRSVDESAIFKNSRFRF